MPDKHEVGGSIPPASTKKNAVYKIDAQHIVTKTSDVPSARKRLVRK